MASYFMQGGDGKEYGPVTAEQLRQWLAENRANAQTQVRPADGGPYQALGTVPELSAAGSARTPAYTPAAAQSAPAGPGSNYFMQGGDGKEYGPVTAEQLRQWVAEGRANAQTQVRLAESGSFLALGTVPELNAASSARVSGYTPSAAQSAPTGPGSNYFMQGGDGKEYGPVTAAQLRQWVAEGRANTQTQVRLAEGGLMMALGSVPELAAAGPAGSAGYTTPGASSRWPSTGGAGSAGADAATVVKRLAVVLAESAGWMKLVAIVSMISGALMCFGPGIFVAWLLIWQGMVLMNAAAKAQAAAARGSEADMINALDRLRFYFKLLGIYLIGIVVLVVVLFIVFIGVGAAVASGGGGRGLTLP